MKISSNKDTLTFRIACEDDRDLNDAVKVRQMVQSDGWKILAQAFVYVREQHLEAIKDVTSTDASRKKADLKAAVYKGFDEAISIMDQILQSADILSLKRQLELQEQLEEAQNSNEAE